MEGGRGFSDLLRNTSEEMFLKTMMENPIGTPAPSLEMLGFKNISQSFRGDSEELFNSWLTNGEIPGYSSASIAHRARTTSRRIATEVASTQQNVITTQKKNANENIFHQTSENPAEPTNEISQFSLRNGMSTTEKEADTTNICLARAWFHSPLPMTRSRSSELRKKYASMQNFQIPTIPEVPNDIEMKQEYNNYGDISMTGMPNANVDTVSSVVHMLKGALERKKHGNHETSQGTSFCFYNNSQQHDDGNNQVHEPQIIKRCMELNMEGFVSQANQIHMGTMSQERSQSESSAAAPALSTGDGPSNSGHTFSFSESSRKHIENGTSDHRYTSKEYREQITENNFKNDRKKGNLVRMGSVSSVERGGDPTKKRRVERTRKMQEAKERNSIPSLPSDMQSMLKRCENLEKEVRSLKLNLSFMNRKDSEQTKQIEELQKQNEELTDEKERLLEEIERIISHSTNI